MTEPARARQRGFTLIELAIVLAIVGLMTSGAMMGISAMRENAKLKETHTALRDVEHALTLFVMRNGRLPWADTDQDGDEDANQVEGTVPYTDLDLGEGEVVDGWGNYLRYRVDGGFSAPDALPCTGTQADYQLPAAVINLIDETATGMAVAYAVVSHGTNGLGAVNSNGVANSPAVSANELANADGNNDFRSEGQAAGGLYDDIVTGRTASQILRDGGCRLVSELTGGGAGGGGGGGGGGGVTPPTSGAGILNRSNLQQATGLEWGADGDTGHNELRVNDTRIRAGSGTLASRESGGNDGLGTDGGGGGLRDGEYVDFIIDAPKQSYTVQINSFGNNTSAEIRAYRDGIQVGASHIYTGSGATNAGVIYGDRSFPDGAGGNHMFDTLRVIGTGKNSFFLYSMTFE